MERFTWKIGLLLILVELIQGFELQNDLENVRCTGRALDLAFALDASSDVSAPYFLKQVNIVKHVVNNMDVGMGNDQVRIGAMTFGDRTRVNLHFSKSTDRNIVNSRINRMKQFGGSSNLANALKIMCGALFGRRRGSRSDVNHMGIILTDGNIKIESETRVAAKACQDSGVELFAIVIGQEVTGTNLRDIVSQPDHTHLLHFANFDDSRRIGDYVIQRTCQAVLSSSSKVVPNKRSRRRKDETYLDEKVCHNKVADVFFLLDSSSSIRKEDFKKQINVVESIIRRFDIKATLTRIGISTFSHEYQNLLSFGDSNNKADVLRKLGTINYLSGGTRTGHALHRLRTKVFDQRSVRPGADRIIVVFTDGRSGDYRRTTLEARLIKASGIKIFVVGIGSHVDREELEDISSEPTGEYLHTFDSFDHLLDKSGLLGAKTCEGLNHLFINDQDVCNSSQPTDVMFMMNQNHLGQKNTNSLMKMVADVVEIFGTDGPFRIGTMFDECPMEQDIPIGSIINKTKLLNKIDDFQYGTPKSMIEQLRFDVFLHKQRSSRRREWHRVQRRARRLGLLFLDRDIKLDDPSIRIASRRALQRGIQLYAIVIGKGINLKQVERSIAPRERIISMPSYDALPASLPSILVNRLCLRRDNYITYNSFSH